MEDVIRTYMLPYDPKRPVVCMIGDGSFNYNPVVGALGGGAERH